MKPGLYDQLLTQDIEAEIGRGDQGDGIEVKQGSWGNLIAGKSSGFRSTDHQGKTRNLHVIHNTIINTGHAFAGGSWNGREGMLLANNILYSRDANALHFANGNAGVTSTGNVVFGDGPKDGCTKGRGLEDFRNLTWDASAHNATPTADAPLENADLRFLFETDFDHNSRKGMKTSGAVAREALGRNATL